MWHIQKHKISIDLNNILHIINKWLWDQYDDIDYDDIDYIYWPFAISKEDQYSYDLKWYKKIKGINFNFPNKKIYVKKLQKTINVPWKARAYMIINTNYHFDNWWWREDMLFDSPLVFFFDKKWKIIDVQINIKEKNDIFTTYYSSQNIIIDQLWYNESLTKKYIDKQSKKLYAEKNLSLTFFNIHKINTTYYVLYDKRIHNLQELGKYINKQNKDFLIKQTYGWDKIETLQNHNIKYHKIFWIKIEKQYPTIMRLVINPFWIIDISNEWLSTYRKLSIATQKSSIINLLYDYDNIENWLTYEKNNKNPHWLVKKCCYINKSLPSCFMRNIFNNKSEIINQFNWFQWFEASPYVYGWYGDISSSYDYLLNAPLALHLFKKEKATKYKIEHLLNNKWKISYHTIFYKYKDE